MKSTMARAEDIERKWFVVDAEGATLGRLATQIAMRLRGKHKPTFTPGMDVGDFIVVINAEKVRLTGNKMENKLYHRHSQFPGGLTSTVAKDVLNGKFPERVLESAVRGMLPKTPLGRTMFRKLRVYAGSEHPHAGQNPEALSL
ncbi:MAG: 50S ribosomal protein L13 [Magnetococcales bacterium]|nr:50S ribosomal protein L13 [Magnetococcales bacterium]